MSVPAVYWTQTTTLRQTVVCVQYTACTDTIHPTSPAAGQLWKSDNIEQVVNWDLYHNQYTPGNWSLKISQGGLCYYLDGWPLGNNILGTIYPKPFLQNFKLLWLRHETSYQSENSTTPSIAKLRAYSQFTVWNGYGDLGSIPCRWMSF